MEWYDVLKLLPGVVLIVPVVLLVLVGVQIVLMPIGVFAGVVIRLCESINEGLQGTADSPKHSSLK